MICNVYIYIYIIVCMYSFVHTKSFHSLDSDRIPFFQDYMRWLTDVTTWGGISTVKWFVNVTVTPTNQNKKKLGYIEMSHSSLSYIELWYPSCFPNHLTYPDDSSWNIPLVMSRTWAAFSGFSSDRWGWVAKCPMGTQGKVQRNHHN